MRALVDLILPPVCAGCGREGDVLCPRCRRSLHRRLSEPAGAPLGLPVSIPAGLVQLEWCAAFSGPVRASIHALKYGGERRLVQPLAHAMAERWSRAGAGGALLTWVPVHAERRRQRGFDQAEELCREAAARLALPVDPLLVREERTRAQHALGRTARAGNVSGAFVARHASGMELAGHWIVLIDDVVTTGSTMAACAAALREAGAAAVSGLAVARER
jgi:ComF family protein